MATEISKVQAALAAGKKVSNSAVETALSALSSRYERAKKASMQDRLAYMKKVGELTVINSMVGAANGGLTAAAEHYFGDEDGFISIPFFDFAVPIAMAPMAAGAAGVLLDVDGAGALLASGTTLTSYSIMRKTLKSWDKPATE